MSDPATEECGGTWYGCIQGDSLLVWSLPQKDLQVREFITLIKENKIGIGGLDKKKKFLKKL